MARQPDRTPHRHACNRPQEPGPGPAGQDPSSCMVRMMQRSGRILHRQCRGATTPGPEGGVLLPAEVGTARGGVSLLCGQGGIGSQTWVGEWMGVVAPFHCFAWGGGAGGALFFCVLTWPMIRPLSRCGMLWIGTQTTGDGNKFATPDNQAYCTHCTHL